ncbi:MAG: nucleotide exchange factor GrpE [Elusimicrobia bacterium]|nr:nucleotide exchange factor GrpE [Elusimicrobiota bacterium]
MNKEEITCQDAPSELETVKKALEEKEKELDNLKDKWMRASADLDNYRKRAEKEKAGVFEYAACVTIGPLIGIYEQLRSGIETMKRSSNTDGKLLEGFEMVQKNMEKVFCQQGLCAVEAKIGQRYDPHFHEVVRTEEARGEEGLILGVEAEGYRVGERLLRPAKVIVSRKKHET